jgi:hypothetical protein
MSTQSRYFLAIQDFTYNTLDATRICRRFDSVIDRKALGRGLSVLPHGLPAVGG